MNSNATLALDKPVILIVDNEPQNLLLLRDMLALYGDQYRLRFAADGASALQSIKVDPPDLILLDIVMPEMDGYEVCQRLKANPDSRNIPVIFLSAQHEANSKVKAFAVGGVDYITKPFDADEVYARVEIHLKMHFLVKQLEQEVEERQRTQIALQMAHDQLEDRVQCRTNELSQTNAELLNEISERKRVEQALRESECRYRHVIETQTEFVVRNRPDGVRTFVNQAFCTYWNITREEAIGHSFFTWLTADQLAYVKEKYGRLTPANPTETHVQRTELTQGRVTWQKWQETGIFDESGQLVEIQAIGRDITRQMRAEQDLRESEARLKGVIDSAMDAIIVIDQHQRVIVFNPAAEGIFGYSAAEIMLQPLSTLIPERFHQSHELLAHTFAQSGVTSRMMGHHTLSGVRRNGEEFPVEISISNTSVNGKRYCTAILRDIEQRLSLEEKYHQAQKMEAVGLVASRLAHDFNNLLTPIMTYADLGMIDSEKDGHQFESFQEIRAAAKRAHHLAQQILDLGTKQSMKAETLDFNTVLADMKGLLKNTLGSRILLDLQLQPNLSMVQADENLLSQVLMNLAINARDAMPHGGVLQVKTESVTVDQNKMGSPNAVSPGSYVLLNVRDSGQGMDEKTKLHLFEPFYTTKAAGKGTGLGLTTVYDIVRKHQGYLQFDSELNQGTIFRIYLPAMTVFAAESQL